MAGLSKERIAPSGNVGLWVSSSGEVEQPGVEICDRVRESIRFSKLGGIGENQQILKNLNTAEISNFMMTRITS